MKGLPLSELVGERIRAFPSSGEINLKVDDAQEVMQSVLDDYGDEALLLDETDGLSVVFSTWRFNLRASNTEPVIRLNVESRGDVALMQVKTAELLALIGGQLV
ncbi:phosphomannomutase/phosphoglucomutase [compost metagenome]